MKNGPAIKSLFLALSICHFLGCTSSSQEGRALSKRGVEVIFEIDPTSLSSAELSQIESLRDLVAKQITARSRRIDKSAIVRQDRGFITVELPNISDVKSAVQELSRQKPHGRSVGFYSASTVSAYDDIIRLFQVGRRLEYKGVTCFALQWSDSKKEILPGTRVYDVAIKGWKSPIIGGEDLAWVDLESTSLAPALKFTPNAAEKLSSWCKAQRRDIQLALVLDGLIVSIAPLKKGIVLGDTVAIDGMEDRRVVEKLAESVNSSALSADLLVRSQRKF